jgi:hypothetical protein
VRHITTSTLVLITTITYITTLRVTISPITRMLARSARMLMRVLILLCAAAGRWTCERVGKASPVKPPKARGGKMG